MPFNEIAYKSRTTDIDFPIYEADGTTGVTLAGSDVVRFKMGLYDTATPVLDIDSVGATASGSVVTVVALSNPALVRVRLAQADLASLAARVYHAELAIVDDSETAPADAIKVVDRGTIEVQGSQGGDVGTS